MDAGGTKTAFVLTDENGRVLARHRSGRGAFLSEGSEGLHSLLAQGIGELCRRAGISPEDITFAGLGFPGYGEQEGSEIEILAACESVIGPGRVRCDCDCYLGWAGSLGMEPGINIVAGTGAICYGVNEAGDTARSSGWGAYCDEGSCRWVGERLIQTFTKQSDGRMPRTMLYEMFREENDLRDDLHFIGRLNHVLGGDGAKVAEFQLLADKIALAGDPAALAIYREAAEELAVAAAAVAKKLEMGEGHRVSYSGGLFRSGALILEPLEKLIRDQGGVLTAPRFSPELGAVLIAMRGADPGRDFGEFAFTEMKEESTDEQ